MNTKFKKKIQIRGYDQIFKGLAWIPRSMREKRRGGEKIFTAAEPPLARPNT